MENASPMRTFDPLKVAKYEKDSWVAYYQKRWLVLLKVSIGLVQSTFGLPFMQTLRAAYLLTRAQMAFAPQDNDVALAERYIQRFFAIVKQVHRECLDPAEAARLEVQWWVVHRHCFGRSDSPELIDALAQAYAAEYCVNIDSVREAAVYRARAMVTSDQWVKDGHDAGSSVLAQEEEDLRRSYFALRAAVGASR